MLLTVLSAYAGPEAMGPQPGVLDTVGAQDSGLQNENPFGVTPPEKCSSQVLRNGVQLPERQELYAIWDQNKAWATPEMAHAITTGAEEMAWKMPSADPLIIGDISRRYGGHLHGHKSHRAGVDADIGIFTQGGAQPQGGYFVNVTPSTIDYEANWLFWRSMLETGLVDRILLDQSLIDAMRRYLIRTGE
ncbi:MAG: penicillin-insensitive murein endopeptidase, partial [Myxococcota bacterium]